MCSVDLIEKYQNCASKMNNLRMIVACARLYVYNGLLHGFWLKEATIVKGWIDDAILFWESYI